MLIFQSPLLGFNRWLENLAVAGKSLTLFSSMREYCRQAELEKTVPKKHEGYQYVAKAVTLDKLLKAKHHFWISLAQDFHPCHISDKQAYGTIPCIRSRKAVEVSNE